MNDMPSSGPWRIEEPAEQTHNDISIKSGDRTVCRIWQDTLLGSPINAQQWANARLIASAPHMLQALMDIAVITGDRDGFAGSAGRIASFAVAKALGRDV